MWILKDMSSKCYAVEKAIVSSWKIHVSALLDRDECSIRYTRMSVMITRALQFWSCVLLASRNQGLGQFRRLVSSMSCVSLQDLGTQEPRFFHAALLWVCCRCLFSRIRLAHHHVRMKKIEVIYRFPAIIDIRRS